MFNCLKWESKLSFHKKSNSNSRIRNIPELNWSISREETPPRPSPREDDSPRSERDETSGPRPVKTVSGIPTSSKHFRGSHSTSRLPDASVVEPVRKTRHSTSQLPSYQHSSTDSDTSSSGEGQAKRRRNFEAFVMTGDRMINLAKTPANIDFQSKYYKPPTSAAVKSLDTKFEDSDPSQDDTDDAVDGVKPIRNDPTSPVASSSHSERKSHQRQNVSFHICAYAALNINVFHSAAFDGSWQQV